jgi:hypothetical protein
MPEYKENDFAVEISTQPDNTQRPVLLLGLDIDNLRYQQPHNNTTHGTGI